MLHYDFLGLNRIFNTHTKTSAEPVTTDRHEKSKLIEKHCIKKVETKRNGKQNCIDFH